MMISVVLVAIRRMVDRFLRLVMLRSRAGSRVNSLH